jgi:hypothetical protein
MTLQDEVAAAFVAQGMRDVVRQLAKEDPDDHRLEAPVGEGWVDVLVKTQSHRLLFEIKTNIRTGPYGEVHDPEVGSSIRQLKKYADQHPEDIVSIIIPFRDAEKWAPHYANEGMHTVTWYATRIVMCPNGHEYRIPPEKLTAPSSCGDDFCGYKGPFEQVALIQPVFSVYGAVEVKSRKAGVHIERSRTLELIENELNNVYQYLGPNWNREKLPQFPLVLWRTLSTSGQLTQLGLTPRQFVAVTNFYDHVEYYDEILESIIGLQIPSAEYSRKMEHLEKTRQVLLQDMPEVRKLMGWETRKR